MTIFPHCLASRVTACNSSADSFRVPMTWPSLELEKVAWVNSVGVSYPVRFTAQRASCTRWFKFLEILLEIRSAKCSNQKMLTGVLPTWVEPDPLRSRAIDPLGLAAVGDKLAERVIPGLSVLTTRAR